MKVINTEIITNQLADLIAIDDIIDFLFEEEHIWLVLQTNKEKNFDYIQIHSETDASGCEELEFLQNHPNSSWLEQAQNGKNLYLIETRKYDENGDFKHYRAFIPDAEVIKSYFEKFFNDEAYSVENWFDVTEEFKSFKK